VISSIHELFFIIKKMEVEGLLEDAARARPYRRPRRRLFRVWDEMSAFPDNEGVDKMNGTYFMEQDLYPRFGVPVDPKGPKRPKLRSERVPGLPPSFIPELVL